jgi:hypothetical protein
LQPARSPTKAARAAIWTRLRVLREVIVSFPLNSGVAALISQLGCPQIGNQEGPFGSSTLHFGQSFSGTGRLPAFAAFYQSRLVIVRGCTQSTNVGLTTQLASKRHSMRDFCQFSPENSTRKSKGRKLTKWDTNGTTSTAPRHPKNGGSQSGTSDR